MWVKILNNGFLPFLTIFTIYGFLTGEFDEILSDGFLGILFGIGRVEKIFEIFSKIILFLRYPVFLTSKIITGKNGIFSKKFY